VDAPVTAPAHAAETEMPWKPARADRAFTVATWVMAAVVLAMTLLLTTLATERLMGKKSARPSGLHTGRIAASGGTGTAENSGSGVVPDATGAATSGITVSHSGVQDRAAESSEEGSLTVYEDGKEVFYLPPTTARSRTQERIPNREPKPAPAAVEDRGTASANPAGGSLLHRVEPEYPEQAREQNIEGTVVLDLWVSADGAVQQVRAISGNPVLVPAAIAAAKQWQFSPHTIDGKPAEMRSRVTLDFSLAH
jgi:TonB family protein